MGVLIKDYKNLDEKVKEIDKEFNVDLQYWVIYGKPAARKIYRVNDEFIELAIYYNYCKDLVVKITKNRIVSENEGCTMSTPIKTIKEEFLKVKQASKKNILEQIEKCKNIDLKQFI